MASWVNKATTGWALAVSLCLPAAAAAAGPKAGASASAATETATSSSEGGPAKAKDGWIHRHGPRRNNWQLGIAAGVLAPSLGADLRADGIEFKNFARVAGDLALRGGYYPLRWLGIELEGNLMPGATYHDKRRVLFYGFRGQVIAQLPFWRVVPFAALGGGVLGVSSDANAVGNDADGMWAWGGGVKVHLTRAIGLRLDVRTSLSQKYDARDFADSEEYLLGLVVRLGPKPKDEPAPERPSDRDGDGFADDQDTCPREPGVAPDGCPVRDADGDGIDDDQDKCPAEPGDPPHGCPNEDADGDGFDDDEDACPEEPGVSPDGCPEADTDGDGLQDSLDKCIDDPENFNGFEDEDGCPDEVPKDVKKLTGSIEGITFETGSAVIRKSSAATLDDVVRILGEHPQIRIEIAGHTDSTGSYDHNLALSEQRANAVRDYLVDKGIDTGRLQTRGAGPDEPRDTNLTAEGRAANRRIEFTILPPT